MVAQLTPIASPEISIRGLWVPEDLQVKIKSYNPRSQFGRMVKESLRYLPAEQAAELLEGISRIVVAESELHVSVIRRHGDPERPKHLWTIDRYGRVSQKVVTDAGVAFIVDAFQNSVELENLKYHGLGSGTGAEAAGNTALGTEFTTQLNPDSTRATGSTTEAAANIYQTVGTLTFDAGVTVQEHGVFSQAATGGGTLLDRSLTGGQALSALDSMQVDYRLTFTAGG